VPGVIVADNDKVIRDILRSALTGIGQTVFLAASGQEALAFAEKVRAGLILLDLNMPNVNGFQVCEKLRAMPGYENTPIVILSVHDGDRVQRAATQVGATLFLTKPFQIADLLVSLAPYLEMDARTLRAVSRTAQQARKIADADPEQERALLDGQPDLARSGAKAVLLDEGRDIIAAYRK
jgi:phosphoserine phosphatase RsbU/P